MPLCSLVILAGGFPVRSSGQFSVGGRDEPWATAAFLHDYDLPIRPTIFGVMGSSCTAWQTNLLGAAIGWMIHSIEAYHLGNEYEWQEYDNYPTVTMHGLDSRLGLFRRSPLNSPASRSSFGCYRQIMQKGFDGHHSITSSLIGGPGILKTARDKLYTTHEYW